MSNFKKWIVPFTLFALSSVASADPWKDESGKGRHGDKRGEYKEEYWDGNCKVERKYDKNEYKEERKCKRQDRYVDRDSRYRQPAQPDHRYRQPAQPDYRYREQDRVRHPSSNYDPRAAEAAVNVDVRVR